MKVIKKNTVLLLSLIMIFAFTSCNNDDEYMDFMKNGWDGGTDPSATTSTISSQDSVTENVSEYTTSSYTTRSHTTRQHATKAYTAKPHTTKSYTTTSTTNKPFSNNNTNTETINPNDLTMLQVLDLYKTSANKIKSSPNGITCTKIKEVITQISGSIPLEYQDYGFKPGSTTGNIVYNTPTKIKNNFCVEGKDYVCNLSYSDIKSATASNTNSNTVIVINVKDDTANTYDHSSKCVSTINIPDDTWTCKNVVIKATINSKGQLISLYTNMPTYVKSGSNSFAFSVEQYWTVSYK